MKIEKQKADKGIEKIEKEEKRLALILHFWNTLVRQRVKKGKWK